jgi:hypothetical protein
MSLKTYVSFLFVFFSIISVSYAQTPGILSIDPAYQHETENFKDVFRTVKKLGEKCRPDQIVIAFDLDNTIMASDQVLGSEQWFDWQSSLQSKTAPAGSASQRVANDFSGLLNVNSQVTKVMTMHPTEKDLPAEISSLEQKHYKVLVLTSRDPGELEPTERELTRNGFHFERSTLSPASDGVYLPYDPSRPTDAGFMNDESAAIKKLGKPRSVLFKDGIYMTSGQNKGYMLRALLQKTGTTACGVVFVDNKEVYSQQMQDAFNGQDVKLATFRYSREDKAMDTFANADKTSAVQSWQNFKLSLPATAPALKVPGSTAN